MPQAGFKPGTYLLLVVVQLQGHVTPLLSLGQHIRAQRLACTGQSWQGGEGHRETVTMQNTPLRGERGHNECVGTSHHEQLVRDSDCS
jgi:hypothetical protein